MDRRKLVQQLSRRCNLIENRALYMSTFPRLLDNRYNIYIKIKPFYASASVSLGTIFIACSSWKSNLAAYGSFIVAM